MRWLHLLLRGGEKDPAAGKEDEAPHLLRRDDDTGGAQIRFETCVLIVKNKLFFFFFFSLSVALRDASKDALYSSFSHQQQRQHTRRDATQRKATRAPVFGAKRSVSLAKKKVKRELGFRV